MAPPGPSAPLDRETDGAAATMLLALQAWALALTLTLQALGEVTGAGLDLWLTLSGARLALRLAQGAATRARLLAAPPARFAGGLLAAAPRRLLGPTGTPPGGRSGHAALPARSLTAAPAGMAPQLEEQGRLGEATAEEEAEADKEAVAGEAGYERLASRPALALDEGPALALGEGEAPAAEAEAEAAGEEVEPLLESGPVELSDAAGAEVADEGREGAGAPLLPAELVGRAPEAPRAMSAASQASAASVDELLMEGGPEGRASPTGPPALAPSPAGAGAAPSAPPAPLTPSLPSILGPAGAAGFTSAPFGQALGGAPLDPAFPGPPPLARAAGSFGGAGGANGFGGMGTEEASAPPLMAFLQGVAAAEMQAGATPASEPLAAGLPASRADTAFTRELEAAAEHIMDSGAAGGQEHAAD
eukprot:scaffold14.g1175.t1